MLTNILTIKVISAYEIYAKNLSLLCILRNSLLAFKQKCLNQTSIFLFKKYLKVCWYMHKIKFVDY